MKENIGESLHRLMHNYRHQIRAAALEADIAMPVTHIRSLKCIDKIHNCSAKDISDKLSLDKSQVTRVLKELLTKSYITKASNPENHRSQLLSLTDSGREQLSRIMMLEHTAVERMTRNLTDHQIEDFIRISNIMISDSLSLTECDKQN
ncbi:MULTISPECIES: MarR family winged helix-turn-helix transcriptional regulator [Marinomonas]|uniref:DNA-binding MarR family transcriptional regulator n=1 Tax=Marinomonas alcarazii TaxID=491949 RepID=A0A318VBG0_9GAMM|nr:MULTISPECIES: MarR family transcriptional regulator [Marinomonas]PYF84808.1 DNA-binding MarR family transcriptional regulator [Marinomonas alcarazii]